MTYSVIDIGTNTILLLVASRLSEGINSHNGQNFAVLHDEHNIARLGAGITKTNQISSQAFSRAEQFLLRYKFLSQQFGCNKIIAVATSAVRSAENQHEFIQEMKHRTGIDISVISGVEEAELTYLGAVNSLNPPSGSHNIVIDIGGGSTEIIHGYGETIVQKVSIEIGAVRLKELFYNEQPVEKKVLNEIRDYLSSAFDIAIELPINAHLIGVAGTVTSLGEIALGTNKNIPQQIHGKVVELAVINSLSFMLNLFDLNQIKSIPQVNPLRADLLPAGAMILENFMLKFKLPQITVSTAGLRYGLMQRLMKSELN